MLTARRLAIQLFRPRPPRGPLSSAELDAVRSLLVVRAHDQLGDFLLATPALRALRLRFPHARITLVANRFLAPLALEQPDVDSVRIAPWGARGPGPGAASSLPRFLFELRLDRYDLAVVLNTVSHSLTSDLVARFGRTARVVGPVSPPLKDGGAPLYDWAYAVPPPSGPHQMHRALASVAPLGCPPVALAYRFGLGSEDETWSADLPAPLPRERVVALHVGTRDPAKQYPAALWARAADEVAARSEARLLLIDAPDARALQREIASRLASPHRSLPPTDLRDLAVVLRSVDVLLCHDSAILHLAAAVGTPTVSIHGRGAAVEWKPPGDRHIALQSPDFLPESIDPAQVSEAAVALLAGATTKTLVAERQGA